MPTIAEERERNDARETRIDEQQEAADPSIVVIVARIAYAATAFIATYVGGHYFLGIDIEAAKEVSLLNAGVAYYTHEAAGKVVTAINALYRRSFRRGNHE